MSDKQEKEMLWGCDHAVSVILKGFEYMCGGFILTPCEVTSLLGIKRSVHRWHQHPKVDMMQKALAQHSIEVEISSSQGCVFIPKHVEHPRHRQAQIMLGEDVTVN